MSRYGIIFVLLIVFMVVACRSRAFNTDMASRPSSENVLLFSEEQAFAPFLINERVDDVALARYHEFSSTDGVYWGDAYGLKMLAPVTPIEVIRDFEIQQSDILAHDEFELKLRWRGKWILQFHFQKPLSFPYRRPPRCANRSDMARLDFFTWLAVQNVNGNTLVDALTEIQGHLKSSGLESKYLVPNPFRALFDEIRSYRERGPVKAKVILDPELESFRREPNALLVVPDWHGSQERFERLMTILSQEKVDWLAFEMIPREAQRDLDVYLSAVEGSASFLAARDSLIEMMSPDVIDPCGQGVKSHYFRVIQMAREKEIQVIGIDGQVQLQFFGPKGPVYNGLSNLNWVDGMGLWLRKTSMGHGVVFGGFEHFYKTEDGFSVQDLIKSRHPGVKIFFERDESEPSN